MQGFQIDGDLVTPDIVHLRDLQLQLVDGLWKIIDQIAHTHVVVEGALVELVALLGEAQVGHLGAEDLPVMDHPFEQIDSLAGPRLPDDQKQGVAAGDVH